MSLRLRFVGGVDARLKSEVVCFGRWVRSHYTFPRALEIRLVNQDALKDVDGSTCAMRWWRNSRGRRSVTAEIAVGSFARTLKAEGPTVAFPTVIAAIGRALKYYHLQIAGAAQREDLATRWGDRLLDAYVKQVTPPHP